MPLNFQQTAQKICSDKTGEGGSTWGENIPKFGQLKCRTWFTGEPQLLERCNCSAIGYAVQQSDTAETWLLREVGASTAFWQFGKNVNGYATKLLKIAAFVFVTLFVLIVIFSILKSPAK